VACACNLRLGRLRPGDSEFETTVGYTAKTLSQRKGGRKMEGSERKGKDYRELVDFSSEPTWAY
jgi:hypothetical protein